jgi:starch-binding outer membrane protein, SusD/RagB family
MKHIGKIAILSLTLLLGACSDYLDLYPLDGLVSEEYWRNKEDLERVMIGAYSALAELDAHLFLNGEVRADMLIAGYDIYNCNPGNLYNKGNIRDVRSVDIIPTNEFVKWDVFYKVINYCNHVIKYAPIIYKKDATFSEYYMNAYISEATALRSLVYFYLVRIFRDVPYVTEPTESDLIDLYPAKTSGDEILAHIIQDLHTDGLVEKMADYYDDDISTKGRMNRFAGYALLSDIALWTFDYELSIQYADKIESSLKYLYETNIGWFGIFRQGNSLEGIFELQYDESLGRTNNMYDLTRNASSGKFYFNASIFTEKLFVRDDRERSLEKTRAEGTIVRDGSSSYYTIYKYIGTSPASVTLDGIKYGTFRSGTNSGAANFILYRYSDVMLMKAEALCQLDRLNEAMDIVNVIRMRANVPVYNKNSFGTTIASAELTILNERALELAFEGKRWFDLLRFVRRNPEDNKDKFIEFIASNYTASERFVVASKLNDENSWYLPIYQDEINNNPNLDQNPYYLGFE